MDTIDIGKGSPFLSTCVKQSGRSVNLRTPCFLKMLTFRHSASSEQWATALKKPNGETSAFSKNFLTKKGHLVAIEKNGVPFERDQLLQLRSGYEATKTIRLSVHWVCVQKTSGKIVDLVCCQDQCAKIECSVQLLVAVQVLGRSLGKFSPEKFFSSPCFEEIWAFADRE